MENKNALRMTWQRQIILEELRKVTSHPTADQVYQLVRRRLPRISLGTVYRNLEVLSRHGFIRKLETGGSRRRFDGTIEKHSHVRCTFCGRIDDIGYDLTVDMDAVNGMTEFEVSGITFEFTGTCPDCQTKKLK